MSTLAIYIHIYIAVPNMVKERVSNRVAENVFAALRKTN